MDADIEGPRRRLLKERIAACEQRIDAGDDLAEFITYTRDEYVAQLYAPVRLRPALPRARSSCGGRRRPGRRVRRSSSSSGSSDPDSEGPALGRHLLHRAAA